MSMEESITRLTCQNLLPGILRTGTKFDPENPPKPVMCGVSMSPTYDNLRGVIKGTPLMCHACYGSKLKEFQHNVLLGLEMADEDFPFDEESATRSGKGYVYTGEACLKGRHPVAHPLYGRPHCLTCYGPRALAKASMKDTYIHPLKCPKCDTCERCTRTDSCTKCSSAKPRRSDPNRASARSRGASKYVASTPCDSCGTISERRTQDNMCYTCRDNNRGERDPGDTTKFMNDNPDMVLDKSDAVRLGLKVFRTGKACQYGHMGWRYVSTHACAPCLKGGS